MDNADRTQPVAPNPIRMLPGLIGVATGLVVFSGLAYWVVGLPLFFIIWADLTGAAFLVLPFATRSIRVAGVLNARRASAFFGIIPALGVVAGVVITAIGLGIRSGLYAFSAVIIVCNAIYWPWFDKFSPRRGSTVAREGGDASRTHRSGGSR